MIVDSCCSLRLFVSAPRGQDTCPQAALLELEPSLVATRRGPLRDSANVPASIMSFALQAAACVQWQLNCCWSFPLILCPHVNCKFEKIQRARGIENFRPHLPMRSWAAGTGWGGSCDLPDPFPPPIPCS